MALISSTRNKTKMIAALLTIFSFIAIAFSSCLVHVDDCDDYGCENGGVCSDGSCQCPPAYYGFQCTESYAAKFIGGFNGTSTCDGDTHFSISSGNGTSDNLLINIWIGLGPCSKPVEAYATVNGNSFSINETTPDLCGNAYTITGHGELNGKIFTASITTSGAGVTETCDFISTE